MAHPTSLLQRHEAQRRERAEAARVAALAALGAALRALLPGQPVYVYGSVVRPGGFRETSDVDIALVDEPTTMSLYRLQGELTTLVGRPVDVALLAETRLRDKIVREGELWTS